jgi:Holliday junction DNA helicase RuvA
MITSVSGILVSATPLSAVIEVGGLGYEVHVPVTTAERLPSPGQRAKLHTFVVYREDAQTLYGAISSGCSWRRSRGLARRWR